MVYIALVEGVLILVGKELNKKNKRNLSEQINRQDLGTIIIDNQEIENQILGRS